MIGALGQAKLLETGQLEPNLLRMTGLVLVVGLDEPGATGTCLFALVSNLFQSLTQDSEHFLHAHSHKPCP